MADERQPRIVEGMPVERAARRGLPGGVERDALDAGPVVRRMGADRIVVALLAPADAAPVAITTRARGELVDAVFQPTIRKGPRGGLTAWHYVLRLPPTIAGDAALAVRVVGLGDDVVVEAPAA